MSPRKTAGILGGMGPQSTVELMRKVIRRTTVSREQDHIRMLADNRPEIPDRTAFLLGSGPSPVPYLRESAGLLEKWGADFIALPCNTAHHFIGEIRDAVEIPVLDMLTLLEADLRGRYRAGIPVAVLSTTGSVKTGLFDRYLQDYQLLYPSDEIQQTLVRAAIYGKDGVKVQGVNAANKAKLMEAVEILLAESPAVLVAGCTEVGLVLQETALNIPVVDPLDLLADEIIRRATR